MNRNVSNILLLEDLSGIRAWLRTLPRQAVADAVNHDDDEHQFPALQAGAFDYLLKEQPRERIAEQPERTTQGEPPLSPSIARRVMSHFAPAGRPRRQPALAPEIGVQFGLSRHTIADSVKQICRKLNVSSQAEAALEAQRLGLFSTAESGRPR